MSSIRRGVLLRLVLSMMLPCVLVALAAETVTGEGSRADRGMTFLVLGMPWNLLLTTDPTPETAMITTTIGVFLNAAVLWALGFGVLSAIGLGKKPS